MDALALAPLILGLAVTSFALRGAFFVLLPRFRVSPRIQAGLRFVPAAVLTALVAPELLLANDSLNLAPGNPRLLAAGVATLVAWRTRNTLACLVAGMLTLHALRLVFTS
jgi:branched-subunit amino acid transport protein